MFQRLLANASGVGGRIGVSAYSEFGLGTDVRMTSHLFGFVADIPWNGRIWLLESRTGR
jgi:hypothetical protein